MHAFTNLFKRILAKRTFFTFEIYSVPFHFSLIKFQSTAFDFYEENAIIGIKKDEVTFSLHHSAPAAIAHPVKAVENFYPTGQLLDKRFCDLAFPRILDL